MKLKFYLTAIFLVVSACFKILCSANAQEARGLNLEIEVVSQASLSISGTAQPAFYGNSLRLNLGNIDAFGINRTSGVFIEKTESGMAYYQSLQINAGITGGKNNRRNLKVSLLRANPTTGFFIEDGGDRIDPGQSPIFMNVGQSKIIKHNISGFQSFDRILGVVVRPETIAGPFSAQVVYSLEEGE